MPLRRRRVLRTLVLLVVTVLGINALSGCGGSTTTTPTGSSAGSYTVTVTGTGTPTGGSFSTTANTTFYLNIN
jgi:ABC-type glycerol-3-phosphate transport system substrate-binding protein